MYTTHNALMAGIFERRPRASSTPMGNAKAMPNVDRISAEHAAPHQERHGGQAHGPDDGQLPVPETADAAADDHRHQDDGGDQRTPLLIERIGAEQDQPVLLDDERPAGAARSTAFLSARRVEVGFDECPFHQRRHRHQEEPRKQYRDEDVQRRREQAGFEPCPCAHVCAGRRQAFAGGMRSAAHLNAPPARCACCTSS
ncbi:hypothetical protein G6F57_017996 [Rhizopus arrhizus]|nr:hypothetical protein G6F57_017996 [Rhizopus arrhizus]